MSIPRIVTPTARNIVRRVFRANQHIVGLDHHDIYEASRNPTVQTLHQPEETRQNLPLTGTKQHGWTLENVRGFTLPVQLQEEHPLKSIR